MKVCQFVTDHGFELIRIEKREQRPRKDDMTFTRNVVKGGVAPQTVLCLVEGDWDIELQARLDFEKALEEVRVALGIQAISGFQQVKPKALCILRLRRGRGKPAPYLGLVRFEVIPQLEVIRCRLE